MLELLIIDEYLNIMLATNESSILLDNKIVLKDKSIDKSIY
jgi:hypothetical protein